MVDSCLLHCIAGIEVTVIDDDTVITILRIIKYPVENSGYSVSVLVPGCNRNGTMTIIKRIAGIYLICTQAIIYSGARKIVIRLIDMCCI